MPSNSFPSSRLCESRGVRFVDGRYQPRVSLPAPWGLVSLGLYESEEKAAAARREVLRHLVGDGHLDPLTAWKATRKAIRAGLVRANVLPKYVVRKGDGFYVRLGKSYGELMGPYPTPVEACCRAMDEKLAAARPATVPPANSA